MARRTRRRRRRRMDTDMQRWRTERKKTVCGGRETEKKREEKC